jgi:hypothetical protein
MPPSTDDLYMAMLTDIKRSVDDLREKVNTSLVDIAVLKTKAGLAGAVAGLLAGSLATFIVRFFT